VVASYAATAVLGSAALAMTAVPLLGAEWILGCLATAALLCGAWLKRIDMSL
jgi:hypothetical protein